MKYAVSCAWLNRESLRLPRLFNVIFFLSRRDGSLYLDRFLQQLPQAWGEGCLWHVVRRTCVSSESSWGHFSPQLEPTGVCESSMLSGWRRIWLLDKHTHTHHMYKPHTHTPQAQTTHTHMPHPPPDRSVYSKKPLKCFIK